LNIDGETFCNSLSIQVCYLVIKIKYKGVAIGGTFDHLHKGHKALLSKAFEIGSYVIIGLSSDNFIKRLGKTVDNDYLSRKKNLTNFLNSTFPNRLYDIVSLNEYFGPQILTPNIQAIVVSDETKIRVDMIKNLRIMKGLLPLDVIVVNIILAEDGLPISSTRIRRGEIDLDGHKLHDIKKYNIPS